jgi:hypothetical protein
MKIENLKMLKKSKKFEQELEKIEFRADIKNKVLKEDIMDVYIEIQDARIIEVRDVLGKANSGKIEACILIVREYVEGENKNQYFRLLVSNTKILIKIKALINAKVFPALKDENVVAKIMEDKSDKLEEGRNYPHVLVTYNI